MHRISVFLIAMACTGYAHAGSLRCGRHRISPVDPVTKGHKRCGAPSHEEQWHEEYVFRRDLSYSHHRAPSTSQCHLINLNVRDPRPARDIQHHYPVTPRIYKRSVSVRQSTYNFGARQFMRQLTFENGILKDIETLKYGY